MVKIHYLYNMKSNKKQKTYTCIYCKKSSEIIGVVQEETHYYSVNLKTEQWEDFHGDEAVESQKLFCIFCKKNQQSKFLGKTL